jgi:hypothetical protein
MTSIEKRKMGKEDYFKVTSQYNSESSGEENEVGQDRYIRTLPIIESIPERPYAQVDQNNSHISFGKDPMSQTFTYMPRQINSVNVSYENNFMRELETGVTQKSKAKKNKHRVHFKKEPLVKSIKNLKKKMVKPISELNKTTKKSKKGKQKQKPRKYEESEGSDEPKANENKHEISYISEEGESEVEEEVVQEDKQDLQSGLPLNVSQSTSEPVVSVIRQRKKGYYNYEELTVYEIRNLKKNFSNFSSWFFVNRPQSSGPPNRRDFQNSGNPQMLNTLKDQRYTLMTKLGFDVDKRVVKSFLSDIFGKFKSKKFFGEKEIGRITEKYFKGTQDVQNRVLPSIYQLIDVEISIQSKKLNRLI